MKKLKIGIIGCGAIGSAIAGSCGKELKDTVQLVSIYDIDSNKSRSLSKKLRKNISSQSSAHVFKIADLIIEAAGMSAVEDILKRAIKSKKDVMIMSVGGLLKCASLAKKARGMRIYAPSGAITGVDGLKASAIAGVESVEITTKKSPEGLKGAPYLIKNNIELDNLREEKIVFQGTAAEAVLGFPKNINVSATLSLAGIGPDKTRVKIIAVPGLRSNIHEVRISARSGIIKTITENVPSPDNPKTSYLASLSAIAMIKNIAGNVKIGT